MKSRPKTTMTIKGTYPGSTALIEKKIGDIIISLPFETEFNRDQIEMLKGMKKDFMRNINGAYFSDPPSNVDFEIKELPDGKALVHASVKFTFEFTLPEQEQKKTDNSCARMCRIV